MESEHNLKRVLTLRDSLALSVGAVIGWLALAGTVGLLFLYLPGSPAALSWPVEWGILLLWFTAGGFIYLHANRSERN